MTFAEKLKSLRKQASMSQEQLAEKLGVSRQAVTKWETGTGIPDIENIKSISSLFDISIDELLSNENASQKKSEHLFESVTEYDIDEPKRYDMKFGGAKRFVLCGYKGEKIRIRLVSDTLSTLQNDFKIKIDDIRKRIDVDVKRMNGVTEATSRIHIPENTVFTAVTKGIGTSISYEKDGQQTDRFDTSDSENIIELNGIKSELVIYTGKGRG